MRSDEDIGNKNEQIRIKIRFYKVEPSCCIIDSSHWKIIDGYVVNNNWELLLMLLNTIPLTITFSIIAIYRDIIKNEKIY